MALNKTTKIVLSAVLVALVGGGLAYALTSSSNTDDSNSYNQVAEEAEETSTDSNKSPSSDMNTKTDDHNDSDPDQAKGRYTTYSEANLKQSGYDDNVLFFFAPWCPECQAFKKNITANSIPDGVQVLEVDYDSSTDLKKKYGVTIQTTFVKVKSNGDQQSKWVGYGKDKTLQAALDNLK